MFIEALQFLIRFQLYWNHAPTCIVMRIFDSSVSYREICRLITFWKCNQHSVFCLHTTLHCKSRTESVLWNSPQIVERRWAAFSEKIRICPAESKQSIRFWYTHISLKHDSQMRVTTCSCFARLRKKIARAFSGRVEFRILQLAHWRVNLHRRTHGREWTNSFALALDDYFKFYWKFWLGGDAAVMGSPDQQGTNVIFFSILRWRCRDERVRCNQKLVWQ